MPVNIAPALLSFSLLAGVASCGSSSAPEGEPPNIVLIMADDCTFRDIGCYGGQAYTPNIDRLAGEGMRMTQCFQAAPMCSPTRHNLYTGLYPVKSGAYPNHTFANGSVKSIAHYLMPLGYRVALSGKQHISPRRVFPFEYSGGPSSPDFAAIDRLFEQSSAEDTRFCLFVCSDEPHDPWNKGDASRYPPEELDLPAYWVDCPDLRNQFSRYLAEVTYFDAQVGQVLRLLDKHGLSEDTIVMVLSEQGNSFPFAKWTLYDSGVQSAMVVRWPGRIEAQSTSDALVEYVDVLPTFVEAAQGTPDPVLDGSSMLGVLLGKADEHKQYVFGIQTSRGIYDGPSHYGRRSVRSKQFKLIVNLDPQARFFNGMAAEIYFKQWQKRAEAGDQHASDLIEKFHSPPELELYDVVADPLELVNLAPDPRYADVLEQHQQRLAAWMQQQGDLGQATELAAADRMLKGNPEVMEIIRRRAVPRTKDTEQ